MDFKLRLSIFPQTEEDHKNMMKDRYDPSKNYPGYSGILQVPADQVQPLIEYLSQCTPNHDNFHEEDFIPISGAGYMNTAKTSGQKYLALQFRPDWKKKQEIEERRSGGSPEPTPVKTEVVPKEKSEWF